MADPLTRDQIDDELRRLDQQYDRLAAALLELDEHQGRKLLDGARLTGVTERRWAEAAAAYANLWAYFEAYKETLRLARVVRGDGSRLSRSDAVELSRLIREPALAVPAAPAVRPTLLGTGGTARIGFAAAVTRMDTDYRTVVEVADAADAVWSRLLPGLDAARERQRAAAELVASLGLDAGSSPEAADLAEASDELARLYEAVRTDPLACWSGPLSGGAPVGPLRLVEVAAVLSVVTTALTAARRLRDEAAGRIDGLVRAVEEIAALEAEVRGEHADVAARIGRPAPPAAPDAATALRRAVEDIAPLTEPHRAADAGENASGAALRWERVGERLAAAERSVTDARAAVLDTRRRLAELLGRRDELRGLLGAYRARAARLGVAEGAEPAGHYQRARELLWTAPCDLDEAAAAVAAFRAALARPARPAEAVRSAPVDEPVDAVPAPPTSQNADAYGSQEVDG